MIYQKLKPLNDSSQIIDADLVKNLINESLNKDPNNFTQLVEDLIFLAMDHKLDTEIVDSLAEGFSHLFYKGLKWKNLENIEISSRKDNNKKIKFIKLSMMSFKNLIKPAFENHFMPEFIQSPNELKNMALKMFNSSISSDQILLRIGERLDINNNKELLDEFMLGTRSFPQMRQLAKIFSIEPWSVINKKNDIETLWPVFVLHMENVYLTERQKTSFEARKEILLSGKSIIQTISTEKTSNIDFKSRLVFSSCHMYDESNYSKLLRDLDIKNINLECIDYNIKGQEQTLKERLLEFGKIKLVNKFEKKKNINVDLSQIIACIPSKAYLISNKKAFLKQYLNNLDNEIDYTKIIEEVIKTKGRKYTNALYDIKCYLPLKKEYLNAPKSYWQDIKPDFFHFIDIDEYNSSSNISHKSFSNLINWISDKNINWSKKTISGNYLITDTIIVTMQLTNGISISDLSNENGVLLNIYKNLSHFEKAQILLEIKNEWSKIWDFANSTRHKQDILNTLYKQPSNTFKFTKYFMEDCLNDNVKIESSFFDEKWENIKKDVEPFAEHDDSAKIFLTIANTVELNSTLSTSHKKINKPTKL